MYNTKFDNCTLYITAFNSTHNATHVITNTKIEITETFASIELDEIGSNIYREFIDGHSFVISLYIENIRLIDQIEFQKPAYKCFLDCNIRLAIKL